MARTYIYKWQSTDTEWWLVAKFYATSGYTSPYQFLTALRTFNPQVYAVKGGWPNLAVNTSITIPIR